MICGWCQSSIPAEDRSFDTCLQCLQPNESVVSADEFVTALRGCLDLAPIEKNPLTTGRAKKMRALRGV